jgi:hypothetical protein
MVDKFRIGQRLLRVGWDEGIPFLRFGTVTKANKQSYYVDGVKDTGWSKSVFDAIQREYRSLFFDWDFTYGSKGRPKDWTVEDTVRCVCRLRRLERRLKRRRIG